MDKDVKTGKRPGMLWEVVIPVMSFLFLVGGLALLVGTGNLLGAFSGSTPTTIEALASYLPDASPGDLAVTNNCCYTDGYDPDCNNIEGGWDRGWYDCYNGGCSACRGNGGGGGSTCNNNGICGPRESARTCPNDCDDNGGDTGVVTDPAPSPSDNNGGIVCTRGSRTYKPGESVAIAVQDCYEMRCEFNNEAVDVNIDFQLFFTGTNLANNLVEEITTPAAEEIKDFKNLLRYSSDV